MDKMFARVVQRYSKQLAQAFPKCTTAQVTPGARALVPLISRPLSLQLPSMSKPPGWPSKLNCNTIISQRFLSDDSLEGREASHEEAVLDEDTSLDKQLSLDDVTSVVDDVTSVVEEERAQNQRLQEAQNATLKIDGLEPIEDPDALQEKVEQLLEALGVLDTITIENIVSFPRGRILCRLSEERSVNLVLSRGRNLRDYAEYSNVFLQRSLCKPYATINYHVRMLKKEGKIDAFQIYNGTNRIRLPGLEPWIEITHIQDLTDLELL